MIIKTNYTIKILTKFAKIIGVDPCFKIKQNGIFFNREKIGYVVELRENDYIKIAPETYFYIKNGDLYYKNVFICEGGNFEIIDPILENELRKIQTKKYIKK